jgi:dolichyl-phosphate beta-glucosyltransferase
VPAYNEAERLPIMLKAALDHLLSPSTPKRTFEIIIVDDGSSDGTPQVALSFFTSKESRSTYAKLQKEDPTCVRVVTLKENAGKGAAVRHGFLHARGERLLMVDADDASKFADLEKLWEGIDEIEKDGMGIAIGSRAHLVGTDAVVKRSFIRNFLMHSLHFILRTLGVGHVRDTQCGFKLFTRASSQIIFPTLHIPRWMFDVELLIVAQFVSIPVIEVPITWHEVPGSKLNIVWDSIRMLRDLCVLRANYITGRWKVDRNWCSSALAKKDQ